MKAVERAGGQTGGGEKGVGEIGKVFGFVSAGLPLGMAITPVPFGLLLDAGRPDLVLPLVGAILALSVATITAARTSGKAALPAAAE